MRLLALLGVLALLASCGGEDESGSGEDRAAWCCPYESDSRECYAGAPTETVCVEGECRVVATDRICINVRCSCDGADGCAAENINTLSCIRPDVQTFCAWRGPFDATQGCRPAERVSVETGMPREDVCLPQDADCI